LDQQVIKQILSIDFYTQHKDKLTKTLFDDEILELYDIIVETHSKFGADISTAELLDLWKAKNPVATSANIQSITDVIGRIESIELYDPDIAASLLEGLWKRDTGQRIARIGIAMAEGKEGSLEKLKQLIAKVEQGFMPTDFGEAEAHDINKLLEELSDANRFRFNIPVLAKQVYGIGRGEFGIVHAPPNTGKTAFAVSLACGPGGYADQGRKVAILGNEEKTNRTLLRCYQAWAGMTKEEIVAAPRLAQERWEMISDKVTVQNIMGWPIHEVEAYLKYLEADVGFIDMADKVAIAGSYDAPHLRLRDLYTQQREIPKRLDCALWAFSQSSNDAIGKTIVTPDMMEGSKIGKQAEGDLIIGIGKYADEADGTENFVRFLTVGKNKINGWHGTVTCKIHRQWSRYED